MNYDLILPIGERCHTKVGLSELFPRMPLGLFDSFGNVKLDSVYTVLKNDFNDFLSKSDLHFVNKGDGIHYFVIEKKYNIRCSHLFACDINEQESLNKYYPVLCRLKESTKNRIYNANSILMCYTGFDYTYTLEEYLKFTQNCRKLFPQKKIDFLFIQYSDTSSIICPYANNGIYIYTIPNHPEKNDKLNDFFVWSNMNVLKLCITKHFYSIFKNNFINKNKFYKKYYFFGVPVWKTKIKGNTYKGYLFGFIPLLKCIKK